MLPVKQQEYYSLKFFDQFADLITEQAFQREDEWSMELSRNIIKHAAKNPYWDRKFMSQLVLRIPAAIAQELESLTIKDYDPRTAPSLMWQSTHSGIRRLIHLKTQTIRSFNE
jgi:hypothetical protein